MRCDTDPIVTPLGYALLCEIRKEPRGGYALRQLFETTPLGLFSSSPGSIYPALKRLMSQGLVRAAGSGRGGRFEILKSGEDVVDDWLAQPVTSEDVAGRLDLCLLRFAYLDASADPTATRNFAVSLAAAAHVRARELQEFLDSDAGRALPINGRLAVEHGLMSITTTGRWAAEVVKRLTPDKSEPENEECS